jgi:hypothetical protein
MNAGNGEPACGYSRNFNHLWPQCITTETSCLLCSVLNLCMNEGVGRPADSVAQGCKNAQTAVVSFMP